MTSRSSRDKMSSSSSSDRPESRRQPERSCRIMSIALKYRAEHPACSRLRRTASARCVFPSRWPLEDQEAALCAGLVQTPCKTSAQLATLLTAAAKTWWVSKPTTVANRQACSVIHLHHSPILSGLFCRLGVGNAFIVAQLASRPKLPE